MAVSLGRWYFPFIGQKIRFGSVLPVAVHFMINQVRTVLEFPKEFTKN